MKYVFRLVLLILSLVIIYLIALFNSTSFEFLNNKIFVYNSFDVNYPKKYKEILKVIDGNGYVGYKFTNVKQWRKEKPVWKLCRWKNTDEVALNLFFQKYTLSKTVFIDIYSVNNITTILLQDNSDNYSNDIYFIHLFLDYGGRKSDIINYDSLCQ